MNMQATGMNKAQASAGTPPRVVIIGSGMSGILMGIKLKEAGISDFTIFEKADRLGGTWRENTYPGIACDVPSHHYCYSFEPNPDWSHRFSPGQEIHSYFEKVASKYGIMPHIHFGTAVQSARWDGSHWRVSCSDGSEILADILVSAAGVLHHPAYPDIEGLETFAGAKFHTARWDHGVDLEGKRVGIIGTGSTAAQIVPAIIDKVGKLSQFQRTAQWIHPLPDKRYSSFSQRLLRRFPLLSKALYRFYFKIFERWFCDVVVGKRSDTSLRRRCEQNLAKVLDPALRAKLTPDYRPGCKRLVFSSLYYPAIQRHNAELVTENIERIEPRGIVTKDGRLHELDVLVLSTGFQADRFLRPVEVTGADGVALNDMWQNGPHAYHSVAVPKMPNLFMLIGPHSPVGNLSLISISEHQVAYIMQCIDKIRADGVAMMPCAEVTARLNADMKEAAKNTLWTTGCNSWYLDKDGNPALYPWAPSRFYREMKQPPSFSDFEFRILAA